MMSISALSGSAASQSPFRRFVGCCVPCFPQPEITNSPETPVTVETTPPKDTTLFTKQLTSVVTCYGQLDQLKVQYEQDRAPLDSNLHKKKIQKLTNKWMKESNKIEHLLMLEEGAWVKANSALNALPLFGEMRAHIIGMQLVEPQESQTLSKPCLETLCEATHTLYEVHANLPEGRGNEVNNLIETQEAYDRLVAARQLLPSLNLPWQHQEDYDELAAAVALADFMDAGNCGEHAIVALAEHGNDPKLDPGQKMAYVSSKHLDHAWAELIIGKLRVILDAWAKDKTATFAQFSAFSQEETDRTVHREFFPRDLKEFAAQVQHYATALQKNKWIQGAVEKYLAERKQNPVKIDPSHTWLPTSSIDEDHKKRVHRQVSEMLKNNDKETCIKILREKDLKICQLISPTISNKEIDLSFQLTLNRFCHLYGLPLNTLNATLH